MIVHFRDERARALFDGGVPRSFPPHLVNFARRKLEMLHAARSIMDLKSPPGNELHALTGDRKGQFAIRINRQYRICFEWREDRVHHVEIVDYH
jgi:proteic killer suppression protein